MRCTLKPLIVKRVCSLTLTINYAGLRSRAFHLDMESFDRRYFVIWQGAWGAVVQAPQATRDAVQSAKEQGQAIAERDVISVV